MRAVKRPSWRETLICFIVLFVNAVIMSVELLATRLLFPRYGNTIFAWSAVITIVIVGLFFGYMLGGSLAARAKDRLAAASAELWAGAALTFVVPFACDLLLMKPGHGGAMPPLFGCFVVFGLPMAFLAAVPPAAVGLLAAEGRPPASAAGFISALSAAGSVAGTLLTSFWLVPAFGVRSLFLGYGAALAALALLARAGAGLPRPGRAAAAAVLLGGCAWAGARANAHPAATTLVEPVFAKDSHYQLVRVFEHGSGLNLTRIMMLDSTQEGAVRLGDLSPVFEYTRAYKAFVNSYSSKGGKPGDGRRFLFIGGGSYTMPLVTARALPGASVEVAELDPVVAKAARDYFRAGEASNLSTILADGRQAAARAPGAYDALFVDAYQGVFAIPFHLATREFFETLSASLKPGGFASFNVIGSVVETSGFLCSFASTLRSVFPRVDLYPVRGIEDGSQNIILVAFKDPASAPAANAKLMDGTGFPIRLTADGLACRSPQLLTDDHAPVEWLVGRYIREDR